MSNSSYAKTLWVLALLLFISALISLSMGRYVLSISQILALTRAKLQGLAIDNVAEQIIFQIRLPRIISAICVGSALAISGSALQGIFRNPLVDPHIIGVTSGSAFGGTLAIFFGWHLYGLFTSTMLFGIGTLALVFLFSHRLLERSLLLLILTGMILSGLFSALVSMLQYVSDNEEKLPSIVFWLMGSFTTSSYQKLLFFIPLFLLATSLLLVMRWRLNLLSLADKEAKALGLNVGLWRWLVIFLSGSLVACQVAISGSIGWVGLIIPHLSRMLVGADHQKLLPCAMLLGAIYMLWIDNLARSFSSAEIPVSILTALIGAPVFALLVFKLRKGAIDE